MGLIALNKKLLWNMNNKTGFVQAEFVLFSSNKEHSVRRIDKVLCWPSKYTGEMVSRH